MQESSLTTLRVGGVPEHFNLPWHLGEESGAFAQAGIKLHWHDCPGGTGEMIQLIEDDALDLVVTLTEGSVAAIDRQVRLKALQFYVTSPLHWGVHVPPAQMATSLQQVAGRRVAVSRMGSGSHLMAAVMAQQLGWPLDSLEYVVVGNLSGAVEAFHNAQADLFLWERFTTQPLVDNGDMRRIDICPTPWPAFLVCASERALGNKAQAIGKLQTTVVELCRRHTVAETFAQQVAERYSLARDEVAAWLKITQWSDSTRLRAAQLQPVIAALAELGLISSSLTGADCLAFSS